jgi:hypothetical protein
MWQYSLMVFRKTNKCILQWIREPLFRWIFLGNETWAHKGNKKRVSYFDFKNRLVHNTVCKMKFTDFWPRGITCPSATLSTTTPTWTDPGSNPSLRGERLATNRLSHYIASIACYNVCGLTALICGQEWKQCSSEAQICSVDLRT